MDFIRLQVSVTMPVAFDAQVNLRANPWHSSVEGSGSETDLYGSSSILSSLTIIPRLLCTYLSITDST